jgi:hypothetical protein
MQVQDVHLEVLETLEVLVLLVILEWQEQLEQVLILEQLAIQELLVQQVQ